MARSRVIENGHYRVHLSGIGGDEFLGQALEGRVQMAHFFFQLRFWRFARELMNWSLFWRRPWIQLFLETLRLFLPASIRCRITEEAMAPEWVNKEFSHSHKLSASLLSLAEGPFFWSPAARDAFQTHARLAGILTNFSPTIAETRYPFLDQTLTEFLMSVPLDQQLRPGERRSLMRRALVNIVPPEILSRKTKQMESRGFLVTLNKHWETLSVLVKDPLSSRLGYVNESAFHEALTRMKSGHLSRESAILLRGIFLEIWIRGALENNVIRAPRYAEDLIAASQVGSPNADSSGLI